MKIAVIYGSNRRERLGIKAAQFVLNKLRENSFLPILIDSQQYPLPLLDKMYKEYDRGKAPAVMEKIHNILENSDGFIIVTGEYNHSIPAALKNLLDHFQTEYYFKPSAIVSYSTGPFGGVRVAVHLRSVLAELGMPAIPSILAISNISESINEKGVAIDSKYNRRIKRFLEEFKWYVEAFKNQRQKYVPY